MSQTPTWQPNPEHLIEQEYFTNLDKQLDIRIVMCVAGGYFVFIDKLPFGHAEDKEALQAKIQDVLESEIETEVNLENVKTETTSVPTRLTDAQLSQQGQ